MLSRIAASIMRFAPAYPTDGDLALAEVFRRADYTNATPIEQARIELASAEWRYAYEEQQDSLTRYFGRAIGDVADRRTLDLGCFTGGRLAFWTERHGLGVGTGIDVAVPFVRAAQRFARSKDLPLTFNVGFGESLPYRDGAFDLIISLDVFEHVREVRAVMAECWRTLSPGGLLLASFPPYFQPLESHLGMWTRIPALQWVFSGRTLSKAVQRISTERGDSALWYAYDGAQPWERSPYLNGITVRQFRKIVRDQGWRVRAQGTDPIFTDGRKAKLPIFRVLSRAISPLARAPLAEEAFLGRISVVLERR
ncbi:MAG: class I SAM-dependent methyltransferase [Gemmatimonadota bacterium]